MWADRGCYRVQLGCSAGMSVFAAYAMVQAGRLGSATPTYDVYDSDNYPQASPTPCTGQSGLRVCCKPARTHALVHLLLLMPYTVFLYLSLSSALHAMV